MIVNRWYPFFGGGYVFKEGKITKILVEIPIIKKQLLFIGVLSLLVSVVFSGCNQISDMFLTDEKRFLGTWESEEMWLGAPTVVVFASDGTFTSTIEFFEFQTTIKGEWVMNDGVITIELENFMSATNYSYQFSEGSSTLTLTEVDGSDSFLLRKQQQS